MRLVDTSLRRPVSVVVGVLFIGLFGLLALFRIPIQLTPDVDRPTVTVSTVWVGASPEEIKEVILQATPYGGIPKGLKAFEAANEALAHYRPVTDKPQE